MTEDSNGHLHGQPAFEDDGRFDDEPRAEGKPKSQQAGPRLIRCSHVIPEPISWLWRGWLARGKLHIIAGQPGVGKSTIALKMAATVSSGRRWPDGSAATAGNVVIWSGEDDPTDTLAPRLVAAGADQSRVYFVGDVPHGPGARPFDPAKDMGALRAVIEQAGGASLVIIDPIVSATEGDSHKNGETRRGLQPVVDLAANLDAAVLGVTHFTKGSEGRSPIDRVTGSLAFGALARVVMVAAKDKDADDGKPAPRALLRAKSNIGPDDGGFHYELQNRPLHEHPDIVASVVAWRGPIEGSARDFLAGAEAKPKESDAEKVTALREAQDWLADFLKDGARLEKDIKDAAHGPSISYRTLVRAKKALGVKSRKTTLGWLWGFTFAADQDRQTENQDCQSSRHGILGTLGILDPSPEGKPENQDCQKNKDAKSAKVFGVGPFGIIDPEIDLSASDPPQPKDVPDDEETVEGEF